MLRILLEKTALKLVLGFTYFKSQASTFRTTTQFSSHDFNMRLPLYLSAVLIKCHKTRETIHIESWKWKGMAPTSFLYFCPWIDPSVVKVHLYLRQVSFQVGRQIDRQDRQIWLRENQESWYKETQQGTGKKKRISRCGRFNQSESWFHKLQPHTLADKHRETQ